jgi:hypothetical protein
MNLDAALNHGSDKHRVPRIASTREFDTEAVAQIQYQFSRYMGGPAIDCIIGYNQQPRITQFVIHLKSGTGLLQIVERCKCVEQSFAC